MFTLESAAVRTTKFMMAAAYGICAAANAVTKGLPERVNASRLVPGDHGDHDGNGKYVKTR